MTLLLRQAPDPDSGLDFLNRFAKVDEQACRALRESPALLDTAMAVFSRSRYFSETLLHRPRLLEWPPSSGRIFCESP